MTSPQEWTGPSYRQPRLKRKKKRIQRSTWMSLPCLRFFFLSTCVYRHSCCSRCQPSNITLQFAANRLWYYTLACLAFQSGLNINNSPEIFQTFDCQTGAAESWAKQLPSSWPLHCALLDYKPCHRKQSNKFPFIVYMHSTSSTKQQSFASNGDITSVRGPLNREIPSDSPKTMAPELFIVQNNLYTSHCAANYGNYDSK